MGKVRNIRYFGWPVLGAVVCWLCISAAAGERSTPLKVDENSLTRLRGHVSRAARPEFDRGRAPDSLPQEHILMMLRRSGPKEQDLQQFMNGQYDPHSPDFHRWLTPQQFLDGLALGQLTPGPTLILAAFVGYTVSTLWGAVVAVAADQIPHIYHRIVLG